MEPSILTYPHGGTNVLGLLWALAGLFPTSIAVATLDLPQRVAGAVLLSGIVASMLLDLWCRFRVEAVRGWQRFFRLTCGGCLIWMPYWLTWFVIPPVLFVWLRR